MTGGALAAVLALGAAAGQVGTAYLRSTEAGTSSAQRTATAIDTPTVLTRAFSGRLARGIVNRWHREHGDADLIKLWAGQAHRLAPERSAEEITRLLAAEARAALSAAAARL